MARHLLESVLTLCFLRAAKRVDFDRAYRRFVGCQSVRVRCEWHWSVSHFTCHLTSPSSPDVTGVCACLCAAALWGPAHGGANEAVIKMLIGTVHALCMCHGVSCSDQASCSFSVAEIKSKDRIPEILKRAKDKNDSFRLMGFGHRVYKNFDPRATFMKQICYDVLKSQGVQYVSTTLAPSVPVFH